MATVQLSDIFDASIYNALPAVNGVEKTALYESGAIVGSELLNSLAASDAKTVELPFWKDLAESDEPNLSNDVPTDIATPKNVAQGEQSARKAFLNQGWSTTDLATELAVSAEPMTHIKARTGRYWMRQAQRRLIACANGILADSVANHSDDMVIDVAIEDGANATSAALFGRSTFVNATFTMGDHWDDFTAFAVHSTIMKRMVDNDDIETIRDSQGQLVMRTYMGRPVIVDDTLPVVAGVTSGFKYTSIMFGGGAFGFGEATPPNPVEVERSASAGLGGGMETLWERKTWVMHPFGYKYVGTPAAVSPSIAELSEAASWTRVIDRKLIPMAFIITNG